MEESMLLSARFILGCLFLASSWGKFLSFGSLPDEILDYRLLSKKQAHIVAYLLPFAELVVGILAIVGFALAPVSLLAILLLLIFTVAISINLFRGRRFSCHCFGSSGAMIGPATLVRNILLMALACWLLIYAPFTRGLPALVASWKNNIQQFVHLETVLPVLGTIVLSLIILFLLSEIDAVLPTKEVFSIEEER